MAMLYKINIANNNSIVLQKYNSAYIYNILQLQLSNRTVSHLLHGDLTYAVQTLLTISEPQIGLEPIHIETLQ